MELEDTWEQNDKMLKGNLIRDEAFSFALQIMGLAKTLRQEKEYELSSQLWRAGTSIGANVEEAQAGQNDDSVQGGSRGSLLVAAYG